MFGPMGMAEKSRDHVWTNGVASFRPDFEWEYYQMT
jgi:hypothetical protein